ncbi:hypothetical protein Avbf_06587, partial [Armadillidium vulgare]
GFNHQDENLYYLFGGGPRFTQPLKTESDFKVRKILCFSLDKLCQIRKSEYKIFALQLHLGASNNRQFQTLEYQGIS